MDNKLVPWQETALAIMKEKEIRQEDVSVALGHHKSWAGHKLYGRRNATIAEIKQIAGVIGVSLLELVAHDSEIFTDATEKELVDLIIGMNPFDRDKMLTIARAFVEKPEKMRA